MHVLNRPPQRLARRLAGLALLAPVLAAGVAPAAAAAATPAGPAASLVAHPAGPPPLVSPDVSADGRCEAQGRDGSCEVEVEDPGSPGGGGGTSSGGPAAGVVCRNAGGYEVPCTLNGAWWSSEYNCYMLLLDPQPDPDHSVWEGRTDGGIYGCRLPVSTATIWVWLPDQAIPVDPAVAARQAIARLDVTAIDIGIVPEPGPDSIGLVGLPTWMWVDEPTETTWGPLTATESVQGLSVTATAQVERVEWDMGDGTIVTCESPGTPYHDEAGESPSPDCGHVYERTSVGEPGEAFTVTATSYWSIEWSGGGESGSVSFSTPAETEIRVGELQVLVD